MQKNELYRFLTSKQPVIISTSSLYREQFKQSFLSRNREREREDCMRVTYVGVSAGGVTRSPDITRRPAAVTL